MVLVPGRVLSYLFNRIYRIYRLGMAMDLSCWITGSSGRLSCFLEFTEQLSQWQLGSVLLYSQRTVYLIILSYSVAVFCLGCIVG